MNKRLLSIFCVLVLLVSLTPVSAAFDLSYSSTPPLATLQMDGETTDYYSDLSGHQSDQDILLDLFQRTKGRTAQITLHKEVKVNTSLVIDDPDTCLTLELDSYGVDLYCTNHSVPLFKVTAGSLTLKGNGEFGASQGVYISGDNAKVVLNGTSIIPYADGTSTVGVGLYGSGSLQIINSHIGNLAIEENYQTGVLIQGGSASECSAVIDLSENFAISGHTGISVEHGGSLVIKGNGRIVSNTQISNGIALKADQHSSVTLSGGRYMSTGTNGIAIKSEYPIGKMLVDGYAFYDYSSGMPLKDINVNDTSSSNSNDLLVKTVDENGPVAMVTTADGRMKQFFSSEYEGSDSAALMAAWEYADNGGASRLTLQRSIEYNASSPLQLNYYNSDLTINIPDGITLTGAARSSELIQVTSGRLNIGNGTIVSKGGQTAIRVVAGELNISGGSITTDCSGYSSIASTIEANSLASVNISGGEISLTNSERTESVCLAADAGSRVTLSGGAFTSNQAAIEADDTVASLLAPGYYFYLETDDGTQFVDLNGHELILGEGGGRYVVELGNAGELVATVVTDDGSKEEFTLGESGTEADALARAIAYAEGKTSTLTVHRGVELSRALELYSGSTKLELCMDSGAYISLDNARDGVIRVLDGELELASGSIRTSGEKAIGLNMNGSCRVIVSGGEVNAGTASGSSAVRLGDDAELVVTGGKLLGQRGVYLERSTYPGALMLSGSADVYGSDCGVYAEGGYIGFSDGLVSSGHIGIYLTEDAGLDMNGDASIAVNGSGNTVGVQLEYGVIANIGGSASIVAHTSGSGASHGIDQAAGELSVGGRASISASSYSSTAYAAFLTGGIAAISGGSFTGTTTNSGTGHGLGVGLNESTVELSGGSFTSTEDGKAVLAFAYDDNVGRLLKSDYSYYDSQNNRVEKPDTLQSLSDSTSYTVKPSEVSGDLVATLEISGETTNYTLSGPGDTVESLFADALSKAQGETATLTLMKSAAPDSAVTIGKDTNLTLVMPEDVWLTANVVVEGTLGLAGGRIYKEFSSTGTSVVTVKSGGCLNVLSGQIDYLLLEGASGSEFSAVSVEAGGAVNISGGAIGYEVYGLVTGKSPSALTISGGTVNMRGGKVSAVNSSSAASNNTAYAIKLTDGEFNMTSGMVQAEDGGYEGNSMTALSVQDGKADLSGGSIESNAQGIHMAGGSAYIGGSAELRADNGAGVLVSDGSLEVYGNAFIQGSTSGVELKNSATGTHGSANIYGNAKITGGDYGMYVDSHSKATVSDMPVFTGNAGLYVEITSPANVKLHGGCYITYLEQGSVRVWEKWKDFSDYDERVEYYVNKLLAEGYAFYSGDNTALVFQDYVSAQICTVKSENASSGLEGEVSISGNLTYGETLTAEITGLSPDTAVLTYKWYRCDDGRGSGAALVGSDATYKLTAADIGKYISVTVTAADLSGSLKDITAAAVEKADNPKKPAGLTAVDGTGVKDGKITGVTSAMEYADNANFAGAKSCTDSEITGLAGGEYYVRYKETATHKAGPAVAIFVGTKTTIETLKVNGVTIVEDYEYNQSASVENLSFDPVNSILTAHGAEINAEQFELTGSVTLRFTGTQNKQNKITGLSENIVPGGELTIQGTGSLTLERDAGSLVYETVGELTVGGRAYRFYGSVNGGWAGIVYEGNKGTVSGNYALCSAAATINAGDTLTIPEGAVLTNNITLTNKGTLIIEDMDSIAGSGSIVGGTNIILDPGAAMLEISTPDNAVFDGSTDYAQQVSLGLKDKIVIQGAEFSFDASAWTRRITRNGEVVSSAVSDGVYIVTYSRDGATIGPVSFSVTRIELPDTITYPIEVVSTEHGSVSASVNWAEAGSKVTLTVTPDDGWKLDSLSATDANGGKLSLTDLGGGKYAFTMPSAKVTVKAVFTSGAAPVFSDVPAGSWYYDAVAYVSENGLMNGVDAGTFDPNGTLTRAMVWTILARLEGVDTEGGASWYAKAQAWAMESGVSDGEDPMGAITREQLVTMLWRYSGAPGVEFLLTAPDAGKISSWAMDAMRWAVSEGIIEGDETGAVNPTGSATRAEAAAIFMRFAEGLEK